MTIYSGLHKKNLKNNKMWLGTELYSGSFGKKYTFKEFKTLIDFCSEIGLYKIDTAECYGNYFPIEKMLGDALYKKRANFILATKFGHIYTNKKKIEKFNLKSVQKQLENSLRNLRTDYIDIYYFHSGENHEFDNDELWSFLNKMKKKGILKELGLSLKHSLVIGNDYNQLNKSKDFGITTVQTVLNKYSQHSLDYVIPFCKKNNIKILGRMPLAKGLLSGKYSIHHKFSDSDDRSINYPLTKKILSTHKDVDYREALVWSKQFVDEIVIGSKNKKQIMENFSQINL